MSSTDKWIKKMWHRYAMEYYSAIKKDERRPFGAIWMGLEIIKISEVRQRRTNIIPYCLHTESKKMIQINLSTKQIHTHTEQTYGCQEGGSMGEEKGWESGISTCKPSSIEGTVRSHVTAQGTICNILDRP